MGTKIGNLFRKFGDVAHDVGGTVLKPVLSVVGLENEKFTPRTKYGIAMDKVTDLISPLAKSATDTLSGGITSQVNSAVGSFKGGDILGGAQGGLDLVNSFTGGLSNGGGSPLQITTPKGTVSSKSKLGGALAGLVQSIGAVGKITNSVPLPNSVQEIPVNTVQNSPAKYFTQEQLNTAANSLAPQETNVAGKTTWVKNILDQHVKPALNSAKEAAIGSITDTFLKTEEGKEIKQTAIRSQIQKYIWVPIVALLGLVGVLIVSRK